MMALVVPNAKMFLELLREKRNVTHTFERSGTLLLSCFTPLFEQVFKYYDLIQILAIEQGVAADKLLATDRVLASGTRRNRWT